MVELKIYHERNTELNFLFRMVYTYIEIRNIP